MLLLTDGQTFALLPWAAFAAENPDNINLTRNFDDESQTKQWLERLTWYCDINKMHISMYSVLETVTSNEMQQIREKFLLAVLQHHSHCHYLQYHHHHYHLTHQWPTLQQLHFSSSTHFVMMELILEIWLKTLSSKVYSYGEEITRFNILRSKWCEWYEWIIFMIH